MEFYDTYSKKIILSGMALLKLMVILSGIAVLKLMVILSGIAVRKLMVIFVVKFFLAANLWIT